DRKDYFIQEMINEFGLTEGPVNKVLVKADITRITRKVAKTNPSRITVKDIDNLNELEELKSKRRLKKLASLALTNFISVTDMIVTSKGKILPRNSKIGLLSGAIHSLIVFDTIGRRVSGVGNKGVAVKLYDEDDNLYKVYLLGTDMGKSAIRASIKSNLKPEELRDIKIEDLNMEEENMTNENIRYEYVFEGDDSVVQDEATPTGEPVQKKDVKAVDTSDEFDAKDDDAVNIEETDEEDVDGEEEEVDTDLEEALKFLESDDEDEDEEDDEEESEEEDEDDEEEVVEESDDDTEEDEEDDEEESEEEEDEDDSLEEALTFLESDDEDEDDEDEDEEEVVEESDDDTEEDEEDEKEPEDALEEALRLIEKDL